MSDFQWPAEIVELLLRHSQDANVVASDWLSERGYVRAADLFSRTGPAFTFWRLIVAAMAGADPDWEPTDDAIVRVSIVVRRVDLGQIATAYKANVPPLPSPPGLAPDVHVVDTTTGVVVRTEQEAIEAFGEGSEQHAVVQALYGRSVPFAEFELPAAAHVVTDPPGVQVTEHYYRTVNVKLGD